MDLWEAKVLDAEEVQAEEKLVAGKEVVWGQELLHCLPLPEEDQDELYLMHISNFLS